MGIFNSFFALGSSEFIIQQFANGCLVIGFSYGCGTKLNHLINAFTLPKVGADHVDQDKIKQLGAN